MCPDDCACSWSVSSDIAACGVYGWTVSQCNETTLEYPLCWRQSPSDSGIIGKCALPGCGDGICGAGEDCADCPQDCQCQAWIFDDCSGQFEVINTGNNNCSYTSSLDCFEICYPDGQCRIPPDYLTDLCPDDPSKLAPGICGCGEVENFDDLNNDGYVSSFS